MKTALHYLKGFIIGVIFEYSFRVEFGYLQATILICLLAGSVIEIIYNK